MKYDPDILIMHPSLHHDIFRLTYKEMQKAIEETYDEDGARSLSGLNSCKSLESLFEILIR